MTPQILQTVARPFKQMANVGILPNTDLETKYNIIAINVLSWTCAFLAAFGPAAIYIWIERDSMIIIPGLIEAIACLVVVCLNHIHQYKAAGLVFYILQCLAITYFGSAFDRNVGVQQMCFFLAGLGMLLFKNVMIRIFCFCITLTTIYVLEVNYNNNLFNLASQRSVRYIVYPVILLLNFIVILLYESAKDARRKEAERVNRLLNFFIAKLSHDSSNSLHRLSGVIENKMTRDDIAAEIPANIMAAMKANCEELVLINNNLLTYTKMQTLAPEKIKRQTVAIKKLLENCADAFQLYGRRKNVLVRVEFSQDFPSGIIIDNEKLLRIINNLLSNALKFTANRTIIKLEASIKNSLLIISVTDQGCGIPDDMKEKIFENYVTQEQEEMSTGLGLPIARHFAHLMGGNLILKESSVNYGSTFELIIPFEQAIIKEALPENQSVFEDFVLLVVDDDDFNIFVTELMLQRSAIRIIKAGSAAQALTAIEEVVPDAILLDVELPDMRGDQLLRILKENRMTRHIPVILASGAPDLDEISGADEKLQKPFKAPALLKLFHQIQESKGIA